MDEVLSLVTNLRNEGWRLEGESLGKSLLTKRLHTERECECNRKSPNLVCEIDLFIRHKGVPKYVTYVVTGEVQGVWYSISAYSMNPSEAWEARQKAERNLLKAWDALR